MLLTRDRTNIDLDDERWEFDEARAQMVIGFD
jgi:hypothetical protein